MKRSPPKTTPHDLRPVSARAEIDLLREQIAELVLNSPQKAAIILSQWINSIPATEPKPKVQLIKKAG